MESLLPISYRCFDCRHAFSGAPQAQAETCPQCGSRLVLKEADDSLALGPVEVGAGSS